jgi:hypothetical protein
MKDAKVAKLTIMTISSGPPQLDVMVNFWNAPPARIAAWEQMLHHSVNLTMVRCNCKSIGNRYESIGGFSKLAVSYNEPLETWWFKPRPTIE